MGDCDRERCRRELDFHPHVSDPLALRVPRNIAAYSRDRSPANLEEPRAPLAVAVGASAGLQTAQLVNVHLYFFAVALWLVFGVGRQSRGHLRPGWSAVLMVCTGLLASTALSGDLVNSRLLAVQLLLLAGASACLIAFADREDNRYLLLGLLATTTVASAAGVLQYLGVLPYEVYLGTDRPIGLYSEPDWLGMFTAVGLVIALHTRTSRFRTALVILHVVALLLSATRAAWLAVIVVGVVGYVVAKLSGKAKQAGPAPGRARGAAVGLLLVVVMLAVSPTLRNSLQSRVESTFSSRPDVAVMARQQQNDALFELEAQSPWHGLGLSASGRVGVSGRIDYIGAADNNVASNWMLGWWVDGGVLALPLILLFAGAALTRLTTTSGLLLSTVLFCSFFSNATLIPISWFALALCLTRTTGSAGSAGRDSDQLGPRADHSRALSRPTDRGQPPTSPETVARGGGE